MVNFKYKSLIDFKKENKCQYNFLFKNNLLEKFCKDLGWENTLKRDGKWNKENCLERALLYTTKRDWKKYDQASYEASRTKIWFDECTAHMVELCKPSGYWLIKENVINEAKKYSTFKEWSGNNSASVNNARKNGWLDECIKHMGPIRKITVPSIRKKNGYWTKENFLLECKKYNTFYDLKLNNPSACECARGKGYLDEVTLLLGWDKRKPLGRKLNKWSKEKILANALLFDTKVAWEKSKGSSYSAAKNHGLYDECTAHMKILCRPKGYWTLERCMVEALKFNLKEDWKKGHYLSYSGARSGGHMVACSAHMIKGHKGSGYWNKERCIEEALKYTTKQKWRVGNQTSYNAAKRLNCIEECVAHMIKPKHTNKPKGYWTKERCMVEALKCNGKTEWRKKGGGSALSAIKNGWFEDCTKHFKNYETRRIKI